MAIKITFNSKKLSEAINKSVLASAKGIQSGLKDVKDDWIESAIDIAPEDTGALKESIDGTVKPLELEVGVKAADLSSASGKDFNYAYYIHDDRGVAVTGEKKFLDVAARQSESEWQSMMERALAEELKKAGW